MVESSRRFCAILLHYEIGIRFCDSAGEYPEGNTGVVVGDSRSKVRKRA